MKKRVYRVNDFGMKRAFNMIERFFSSNENYPQITREELLENVRSVKKKEMTDKYGVFNKRRRKVTLIPALAWGVNHTVIHEALHAVLRITMNLGRYFNEGLVDLFARKIGQKNGIEKKHESYDENVFVVAGLSAVLGESQLLKLARGENNVLAKALEPEFESLRKKGKFLFVAPRNADFDAVKEVVQKAIFQDFARIFIKMSEGMTYPQKKAEAERIVKEFVQSAREIFVDPQKYWENAQYANKMEDALRFTRASLAEPLREAKWHPQKLVDTAEKFDVAYENLYNESDYRDSLYCYDVHSCLDDEYIIFHGPLESSFVFNKKTGELLTGEKAKTVHESYNEQFILDFERGRKKSLRTTVSHIPALKKYEVMYDVAPGSGREICVVNRGTGYAVQGKIMLRFFAIKTVVKRNLDRAKYIGSSVLRKLIGFDNAKKTAPKLHMRNYGANTSRMNLTNFRKA